MKHVDIGICFLATLLLVMGCSKEEELCVEKEDEVKVSFKARLDAALQTRSGGTPEIGKGGCVDVVKVAVYQKGEELSELRQVEHVIGGVANVDVTLVKGQTYDIAFWAQDYGCQAYSFDYAAAEIEVDYSNMSNNNDGSDAFFGSVTNFIVDGSFSKEVTLRRPFAQINVGSVLEDYQTAVTVNGLEVACSSASFSGGVGNVLHLLTGSVTATDEAVSLPFGSCPTQPLSANNTYYKYLSMTYLLVSDGTSTGTEQAKTDVTFTFRDEGGNNSRTISISDLPVRRNYRTNVTGYILTAENPEVTMQTITGE